jgi:hypothetical protein
VGVLWLILRAVWFMLLTVMVVVSAFLVGFALIGAVERNPPLRSHQAVWWARE